MTDSRYLFVYGTLMSGAGTTLGKSQRLRLARQSDSLGPASLVRARLYDLGRYPGVAAGDGEDDIVHGEAVLLSTPETTLEWLDAYEGIAPTSGGANEYERKVCGVRLAGGEAIDAWVYLLRAVPARAKRIGDGRWMPH